MRSPEIEPARLERLLAGFAPETAQEAILQGLVRELRGGMPEASLVLRERVRTICEPSSKRRVAVTRRRVVAVALAGALLAAVGAFAVVDRDSSSRSTADDRSALLAGAVPQSEAPSPAAVDPSALDGIEFQSATPERATFDAWTATGVLLQADSSSLSGVHAPVTTGRAQDVKMSMALRVADTDALSQAVNESMALTRELGGHVTASAIDTQGTDGSAELALSIPVGKLEDAIVQLSALGTITGQNVRTVDLQGGLDKRAKTIERLQRSIEADELRLASGTLSPSEQLTVELRLARTRADLRSVQRERARITRQAANAELALSLRTGAAAAKDEDEGRVMGAVRDGFDFLAAAGAIALLVLIAASPLIVLGVLLWLLLRTRRRRIDERLLADPQPPGRPRAAE